MRVAALNDIHGNLPALDAVLGEVAQAGVDTVVCGGDVDVDLVVCGHTHMQFDRQLPGGLRVVNAGSVGMPYEGRRGAFWALLGPSIELRHTEYDVDAAVASFREAAPWLREQLTGWLLDPRDPDEATGVFEAQRGA